MASSYLSYIHKQLSMLHNYHILTIRVTHVLTPMTYMLVPKGIDT